MASGTVVSRSTRTVEEACAEWLAGRHSIRPRPSGLATSTLYRRCATDTVLGQRLHLVCGQHRVRTRRRERNRHPPPSRCRPRSARGHVGAQFGCPLTVLRRCVPNPVASSAVSSHPCPGDGRPSSWRGNPSAGLRPRACALTKPISYSICCAAGCFIDLPGGPFRLGRSDPVSRPSWRAEPVRPGRRCRVRGCRR